MSVLLPSTEAPLNFAGDKGAVGMVEKHNLQARPNATGVCCALPQASSSPSSTEGDQPRIRHMHSEHCCGRSTQATTLFTYDQQSLPLIVFVNMCLRTFTNEGKLLNAKLKSPNISPFPDLAVTIPKPELF